MQAYANAQPRIPREQLQSVRPVALPPEAPTNPALDGALIEQLLGRIADLVVDRLAERATPGEQPAEEWMDARAAAAYLGVHRDTLRKLAAQRSIPVHQDGPGCKLYFNRDELDEWRRSGRGARSHLRAVA